MGAASTLPFVTKMVVAKSRTANAAHERNQMGRVDTDPRLPKWTLLFNCSPEGTRWNTRVFSFYDDVKIAQAEYDRMAAFDKELEASRWDKEWLVEEQTIYCPTLRRFHWTDIPHLDGGGIPSPRAKAQELIEEVRERLGPHSTLYGGKPPSEGLSEFVRRLNEFKLPQV